MANEALAKAGLYVDELNKIRIADPNITRQTQELKDDCHKFVDSELFFPLLATLLLLLCTTSTQNLYNGLTHSILGMVEFQGIVNKSIAVSNKLAILVEQEKLKVGFSVQDTCKNYTLPILKRILMECF